MNADSSSAWASSCNGCGCSRAGNGWSLSTEATTKELSYADFLDLLLTEEVSSRPRRTSPCGPTWPASPSSRVWMRRVRLPALDRQEAAARTWPPATTSRTGERRSPRSARSRKTHLAVGLGSKAIERDTGVLTTASGMIATLAKAMSEGRLRRSSSSSPCPGC